MTHQLIITGQLLTCDSCAFRAILTTRQPFIRAAGDPTVDHLATLTTQQASAHDLAEPILNRLRNHYTARHVAIDHALDARQLQRLYRAVIGEFAP